MSRTLISLRGPAYRNINDDSGKYRETLGICAENRQKHLRKQRVAIVRPGDVPELPWAGRIACGFTLQERAVVGRLPGERW